MPRPRKTEKEKNLLGTAQKCRVRKLPVVGKQLAPEPPTGLRQEAKDVWKLAIENAPPGTLNVLDLSVLERWCRNYALYRKVAREVDDQGVVSILDDSKLSGKFNAMIKLEQALLAAERELGFTPLARTRVTAPTEDENNDTRFANF